MKERTWELDGKVVKKREGNPITYKTRVPPRVPEQSGQKKFTKAEDNLNHKAEVLTGGAPYLLIDGKPVGVLREDRWFGPSLVIGKDKTVACDAHNGLGVIGILGWHLLKVMGEKIASRFLPIKHIILEYEWDEEVAMKRYGKKDVKEFFIVRFDSVPEKSIRDWLSEDYEPQFFIPFKDWAVEEPRVSWRWIKD